MEYYVRDFSDSNVVPATTLRLRSGHGGERKTFYDVSDVSAIELCPNITVEEHPPSAVATADFDE